METLESDETPLWVARTWGAVDTWLGWLAVILNLHSNGILPCTLFRTGGRLLLTRRGAAEKAGHNVFAVKFAMSPKYFSVAIGEVNAQLYATPGSHLYEHYIAARKKLPR